MKEWIYEEGKPEERRFASEDEAQKWFAENDPEGVAFAMNENEQGAMSEEWKTYTPTVTSHSGEKLPHPAAGKYRLVGKTVILGEISIEGPVGDCLVTLPDISRKDEA